MVTPIQNKTENYINNKTQEELNWKYSWIWYMLVSFKYNKVSQQLFLCQWCIPKSSVKLKIWGRLYICESLVSSAYF